MCEISEISELESGRSGCRASFQFWSALGILQTRIKKKADLQLMGIEYRLLNEKKQKKQTDKPSDLVGRERLRRIAR